MEEGGSRIRLDRDGRRAWLVGETICPQIVGRPVIYQPDFFLEVVTATYSSGSILILSLVIERRYKQAERPLVDLAMARNVEK
jgi:hypothetical protein